MLRRLLLTLLCAAMATPALAADRPLVIELFTSQGCSSCPAADAMLLGLANDPSLLPLSLHVHYWDYLGWKDKFASEENTRRQKTYKELHNGRLYTPQMIVDGGASAVGNNETQVTKAIEFARRQPTSIPITLTRGANTLAVELADASKTTGSYIPDSATVYAMQFRRHDKTLIEAGENRGRNIESVNNVVRITQLGTWDKTAKHFELPLSGVGKDGIAIIVQAEAQGRIVGAARFLP